MVPLTTMSPPLVRVRDVLGVRLDEIPGASIAGDIPIPDEVINRFIAQALARAQAPVTRVRIETGDADRLLAYVTIRGPRLIPELKVLAEIERQPELPQSPVLGLRWSLPGMGPLAMIAAPFLSNLKNLPPGIRIEGERALIDLGELLRSRGMADLLPLVARLNVGTRSGRLVVRFEVRT
jgi:hypothetical protein